MPQDVDETDDIAEKWRKKVKEPSVHWNISRSGIRLVCVARGSFHMT